MYEYLLWPPLGGTHSTKLVEFDGILWPYTSGVHVHIKLMMVFVGYQFLCIKRNSKKQERMIE